MVFSTRNRTRLLPQEALKKKWSHPPGSNRGPADYESCELAISARLAVALRCSKCLSGAGLSHPNTLRPRLEAVGADLTRVHFVVGVIAGYTGTGTPMDRTFSLQVDMQALNSKLEELEDLAVVVIDPITAYLDAPIPTGTPKSGDFSRR